MAAGLDEIAAILACSHYVMLAIKYGAISKFILQNKSKDWILLALRY